MMLIYIDSYVWFTYVVIFYIFSQN